MPATPASSGATIAATSPKTRKSTCVWLLPPAPGTTEEGEAHEQVGDESDRDDESEHGERDADVVIADVCEFVTQHTFQLPVGHDLSRPVVTVIAALSGVRPVANAFGAGSSTTYSAGMGVPVVMQRFSTRR